MAKAIWNGTVLAESDDYETVEGNVYFPPESVKKEYLKDSGKDYECPWKGHAEVCENSFQICRLTCRFLRSSILCYATGE